MRAESLFKMSRSGDEKESLSLRETLLASALATDRISWMKLQRNTYVHKIYKDNIQTAKIMLTMLGLQAINEAMRQRPMKLHV